VRLARLRTRTDNLFHTSPGKPRKVALDPAGERALRGIERRERRATMGHIRFRVSDGGLVVTERFGAAKQVP